MANKLTNEEVDKRIFNLVRDEYIRLGEYKNAHSKLLIKHNICGNEYKTSWHNFEKIRKCPECSKIKNKKQSLTNKEIDKRILKIGNGEYTRLGEYKNSKIKFLIKHNVCGNEYEVAWSNFYSGKRCPKCSVSISSQKRSFNNGKIDKEIYKLVEDEYIRLGEYKDSKTKFLIKHITCGNEYTIIWGNFKKGQRCPKCYGNKKLNNETVDKEILKLVGDEYVRYGEYKNNSTKILIKHNICGNKYMGRWSNFQSGQRCPECYGTEKRTDKYVEEGIHNLVGNEYSKLGKYLGANKNFLMKHNVCENEYMVSWANFRKGKRCPKCASSKGEKKVSDILKRLNMEYVSEKRFKNCKNEKPLPFDFYIANKKTKLLIEFDGKQHFQPIEYFGGKKQFERQQVNDSIKTKFAKDNNIPLLRIPYAEIDNIETILVNKLKELNFIK